MASSSVKCELRVIGAKHVAAKRKGSIFIRSYISAGNNRRIQLNTREIISSKKVDDECFSWDEVFSLECDGEDTSVSNLKEQNIVFELRCRNTKLNFLGKTPASQLIASAEVPWKSVFEAHNMEVVRWVSMAAGNGDEGFCMKPPALQVGIKVDVTTKECSMTMSKEEMRRKRRGERLRKWDDCGCSSSKGGSSCGCSCADNELLLVAATLDVF